MSGCDKKSSALLCHGDNVHKLKACCDVCDMVDTQGSRYTGSTMVCKKDGETCKLKTGFVNNVPVGEGDGWT